MPITFQFEVPPAYIPRNYYDGMRGLSGGIFGRSLDGLGDAASDATQAAIDEFKQNSLKVRNEVNVANTQLIIQATLAGRPGDVAQFAQWTSHLDSIAGQINQGQIGKIDSWAQLARQMISMAKDDGANNWWQNLPSVEEWITILEAIPGKFAQAIVATAGTAGQAAGDLLRNAGVDPSKLADDTAATAKWLGAGAVALAVIYLVSR